MRIRCQKCFRYRTYRLYIRKTVEKPAKEPPAEVKDMVYLLRRGRRTYKTQAFVPVGYVCLACGFIKLDKEVLKG